MGDFSRIPVRRSPASAPPAACGPTASGPAGTTADAARPGGVPSIVGDVLSSAGRPLDVGAREAMETTFGRDFGSVRVHAEGPAAASAAAIGARAYTLGNHVVFGQGLYRPDTTTGRRLLAHELTHVVQQGDSGGNMPAQDSLMLGAASDTEEVEAAGVAAGTIDPTRVRPAVAPGVQRAVRLTPIFNSTMRICRRLLTSRTFRVTEGNLVVTANAAYERLGTPECSTSDYHITLTEPGLILDSEFGDCEFPQGRPFSRQWARIPNGEYYLTIWTNNTNPYCCLTGAIEVSQERSVSGPSCTVPPPGPLEILHTALDLAGLIPVLGAIPDAVNTGIYVVEGDWVNAGLSAAAMVPVFGDAATVAKLGTRTVLRVTGEGVTRVGRGGIEAGLREARASGRAAGNVAEGLPPARRVDPGVDDMVERGIVEEAASTTAPARRPRLRPTPNTGFGEAARRQFDRVRDGYARRLRVQSGGQVHHAVELQTLDRYPGVFRADELNDFANMRGIGTELAGRRQLHNSKVRELWDQAYRNLDDEIARRGLAPGTQAYNDYVRRYLEAQRDTIDHVLGQFFTEYRSALQWQRSGASP